MVKTLFGIDQLADSIVKVHSGLDSHRSALIGISGIDSSGKGFIAAELARVLRSTGYRCAVVSVDDWLNLPGIRFGDNEPGRHFYDHALRLDEMFERLVLPLKTSRRIRVGAEIAEETSSVCHSHTYEFDDIDIILLEGIFIFREEYLDNFDLRIWIDCDFEGALQRAVTRAQEGLSEKETIAAYRNIYFPAQIHHISIDEPKRTADIIFNNS